MIPISAASPMRLAYPASSIMPDEKDAPNLGGRPSKYDPAMCSRIVELMREGASKHEVAAELGIAYSTIFNWQNDGDKADFQEAMRQGEMLSQAWWERAGRMAVMGELKGFNATAWVFSMKNRFGWRDKKDIELSGPDGGAIQTANAAVTGDELRAMIRQAEQDV
ncbi:helix-turn-helix domain-containing protein [Rhodopila sp.]|uniref:helix-turn-helix domain-containing protein n=1 Tax=Rhodopila sp. TaxID=2480087 RepID=UPI003D0F135E